MKSIPTLTPSSGYPTKLDLQLVSGTASLVTALNGTLIPTYAARGAHRPLDDLIAADPDFELDDFYPRAARSRASTARPTRSVSMSRRLSCTTTRRSCRRPVSPLPSRTEPMTWATFRDLAKELTRPPDQYGFTCSPAIDDLVSWIYCAGGNVMDDSGDRQRAERARGDRGDPVRHRPVRQGPGDAADQATWSPRARWPTSWRATSPSCRTVLGRSSTSGRRSSTGTSCRFPPERLAVLRGCRARPSRSRPASRATSCSSRGSCSRR